MIEIYMLVQLVAIADCGTMSKAAEQLHLSQPALSRTVNKLEDMIGVKLFDRSKNKVELNENGKLAVELARKVIDENEALAERVRSFDMSRLHTRWRGMTKSALPTSTARPCCCSPTSATGTRYIKGSPPTPSTSTRASLTL